MQTNIRRLAVAAGTVVLVLALSGFRYTGFGDNGAKAKAQTATTWLKSQQLADGSFEVAGFAGFETPDAVLAIAENAQTSATWSRSEALNAVLATKRGSNTALHAIDDLADSKIDAGQAAKIVELVARPLGLSVTKFNPDKDHAVNLEAIIDAGHKSDGSYGAFNATLFAAIAKRKFGGVPADTLAFIRAAQESGGGWNFAGDPTGVAAAADTDTTALAIEALVAAGVKRSDPDLQQGLTFLAQNHRGGRLLAVLRSRRPELHVTRSPRDHRRGLRPDDVLLARLHRPGIDRRSLHLTRQVAEGRRRNERPVQEPE